MKKILGNLHKMTVEFNQPVQYTLTLGEETIVLNSLLGKKIQLHYNGVIHCVQCNRKTTKSFQQGYCFPCYKRLLECNLCIIHPEKCQCYEGTCKPDDWAHAHCLQPHIVYLANSSGLKVGITRGQATTRWIDQGATQGLVIARVQNRYQSGLLEVALKNHIADKTNWQAMLKANNADHDLIAKRDEILQLAQTAINQTSQQYAGEIHLVADAEVTSIKYPVLTYPDKVKAINLDKDPLVSGTLQGIKGQYLLLDTGVLSIRKFAGYQIELITE